MKKGRLSKVEIDYIHNNHEKLSVGDIAKDLDRSTDIVKKEVNKLNPEEKPHVTSTIEGTKAGDFLGRKVINGRVVSTVMTGAASERADDARMNRQKVNTTRHSENAIHSPLGNVKFDKDGNRKPK